jgi:heme/copper-type cytochrome/quinol oxidase subunit 2
MIPTCIAVAATAFMAWGLRRGRGDERGETTEKVIITALFAALALTAATIITLKVTQKANSIPTDPAGPVTTVANNGNGGTLGP